MNIVRYRVLSVVTAFVIVAAAPDMALCADLEFFGFRGLNLFDRNRQLTIDGREKSQSSGYFSYGGEVVLSSLWWDGFAFVDYSYKPSGKELERKPWTSIEVFYSSHMMVAGIGRGFKIGSARLGLKAGYGRLHDVFTMVQWGEFEVTNSVTGNTFVVGTDLLVPIIKRVGIKLSYTLLNRESQRISGSTPVPNFPPGDSYSITLGPREHFYWIGVGSWF